MDRGTLLKLLANGSQTARYAAGELVFRQGDPPDKGLCLVLAGSVSIMHEGETGRLPLASIRAGEFFGEAALVLKRKRSASAFAAEPDTAVMFLTKERMLIESRHNYDFLHILLIEASRRMERMLHMVFRQEKLGPFVMDSSLEPIIAENGRCLARIPQLLNHTRNVFVGPNKPVFTQGQRNDGLLYIVTSGTVNIERQNPGHEPLVLFKVGTGDFFGYSHVASSPSRLYTAVARGEAAHIISCDEELLDRVFRLDNEVGWYLFRALIVKLLILNDSLAKTQAEAGDRTGSPETDRAIRSLYADCAGVAAADACSDVSGEAP